MNTWWQEKEFKQICSRESLTEKAAEIEKTISVKRVRKETQETQKKGGGEEGPSTLAILITEDPTALQCWSEL